MKRKMNRREFLGTVGKLGAAAAGMGVLASCQAPAPTPPPAPAQAAPVAVPTVMKAKAKIELQYQDWTKGTEAMYQGIVAQIQKDNPNIEVVLAYVPWAEVKTATLAKMAGGKAPDILHNSSNIIGADLWELEPFIDLKPFLPKAKMDEFVENSFKEVTMPNGDVIGVPTKMQIDPGMYLNLDLFKRAGAKLPKDPNEEPWTWDEALEAAKKITALGDSTWGWAERAVLPVVFGKAFVPYFWVNGTDLIRQVDKGGKKVWRSSFDLPATQEALKLYVGLANEYKVAPRDMVGWGYAEALAGFGKNKIGMIQIGMFFAGGFGDYPNLKYKETFDVNLMPVPKKGMKPVAPLANHYLSISKQCKYPEEAWKVITYFMRPDNMQMIAKNESDVYPPLKEWMASKEYSDPWHKRWPEWFKYGAYYTNHGKYLSTILATIAGPIVHETVLGNKKVDDAIKELDRKINAELGFTP